MNVRGGPWGRGQEGHRWIRPNSSPAKEQRGHKCPAVARRGSHCLSPSPDSAPLVSESTHTSRQEHDLCTLEGGGCSPCFLSARWGEGWLLTQTQLPCYTRREKPISREGLLLATQAHLPWGALSCIPLPSCCCTISCDFQIPIFCLLRSRNQGSLWADGNQEHPCCGSWKNPRSYQEKQQGRSCLGLEGRRLQVFQSFWNPLFSASPHSGIGRWCS